MNIYSFLLQLIIAIVLVGMWKAGLFFGIGRWAENKKKTLDSYKTEKELLGRITKIKKSETK